MIAASSIETEGNKEPLPKCFKSCLYNISLVFTVMNSKRDKQERMEKNNTFVQIQLV